MILAAEIWTKASRIIAYPNGFLGVLYLISWKTALIYRVGGALSEILMKSLGVIFPSDGPIPP